MFFYYYDISPNLSHSLGFQNMFSGSQFQIRDTSNLTPPQTAVSVTAPCCEHSGTPPSCTPPIHTPESRQQEWRVWPQILTLLFEGVPLTLVMEFQQQSPLGKQSGREREGEGTSGGEPPAVTRQVPAAAICRVTLAVLPDKALEAALWPAQSRL